MKMLVTGSSSGIGQAIAIQAAKEKYDLIVVARRLDKLNELKEELEKNFGVDVEVIEADLTDRDDIKKVVARLKQNDIDVLVNNAGFGSSGPFSELDIDNELNEIDLNIRALVELTHGAAVSMVEKRSGFIVNISSVASYMPMVGNATYGASKAFVTSFSHAISQELKPAGVGVLLVCPGPTESEFFMRSNWIDAKKGHSSYPSIFFKDSDQVAKLVLNSIKKSRNVVIPGILNKILSGIVSSLPGSVTKKMTAVVAKGRRTR